MQSSSIVFEDQTRGRLSVLPCAVSINVHNDHLKNYVRELAKQRRRRTAELAASWPESVRCLDQATE